MRAIVVDEPGDENALQLKDVEAPDLGPGDLRIGVVAAGVNRADLMQRQGFYPPPPGASPIIGLECSGEVLETGSDVKGFKVGDRVMALLAGGAYAEQVVVDAGSAIHVPDAFSMEEAAVFPEVYLTVFLNVFRLAGLPKGGAALVHGGGSGIGTASIQLVKASGGKIIVTAGSDEKCARCRELGADVAVNYREGDFVAGAKQATDGRGVDVVLDSIGAPYLAQNLKALDVGGRLVLIGLMGGAKAEIGLGELLVRRLQIIGSTLRARPVGEKADIVREFLERFGSEIGSSLRPIVDRVMPLDQVAEAHRIMKASTHFGKIVLKVA